MLFQHGKAYPQDLRERVLALDDAGVPNNEIARRLLVTPSWVSKVRGRWSRAGEREARPQRCHVPRKLAGHEPALREHVTLHPDRTLEEIQSWVLETLHIQASTSLLSETLCGLGLTRKKRRSTRRNRTARMSRRSGRNGGRRSPASILAG